MAYRLTSGVCLFAAAVAFTGPAPAHAEETLRLGAGLPPTHLLQSVWLNRIEEIVEEAGVGIDIEVYGAELLKLGEIPDGVRDGVMDGGFIASTYHPAEYPEHNLPSSLSLLGRNGLAMAGAMTEYVATCADCQAEHAGMNQVFLGGSSSDPYVLLTTQRIQSLDDIQGKDLRSAGASFNRWADTIGANPVRMSTNEAYEAISQGVVDGTMHSKTDLINMNFKDVVTYINDLPVGTYHGGSLLMNKERWADLSVEQRKVLLQAFNQASGEMVIEWVKAGEKGVQETVAAGAEFVEPSPELLARSEEIAKADVAVAIQEAKDNLGIADAEEKVNRMIALIEKWEGIAEGIETPEDYWEAVNREVWSKIDLATYGG